MSAFRLVLDCFKFSSIAYLQLAQNEQAQNLASEIIDCLSNQKAVLDMDRESVTYYYIQALLIRAKAFENHGNLKAALLDLEKAY